MDLKEYSGRGSIYLHLANNHRYLTASEDDYSPPPFPVAVPTFKELEAFQEFEFGASWKNYFFLTEEFTFLNHGAAGCALKASLNMAQEFERYMDSQPLRAKDRELLPLLAHVKRKMADFMCCDPVDIFLTENCTSGINTILKSLPFTTKDVILTLNIGYGAVGFAVDRVCEMTGATHRKIDINLPVTDPKQIIDTIRDALQKDVKFAIFDHIPTNTAFIMPVTKLVKLCKERDILVLIDGAHSLGQLDINVSSYGADFYVTNCHKWFCNTRGSAIAYVRKELQERIKPLVVSWGYNRGFMAEFGWSGTQYYSQYVSLLSTLNFWRTVGGDVIRSYCSDTVKQAARVCYKAWNVEPVYPESMMGMMALVKLPQPLNDKAWKPAGVKLDLIVDCLYFVHKIEVPIRQIGETLYVRISCHIYNQMSDFEKLSSAVLDICENRDSLVDYNSKFNQIPPA